MATNNWSKYNIYIVSIGPVKENNAISVNNAGINEFNDSLKELVEASSLNNIRYIDLNLKPESINKYDYVGLHYSEEDYQKIYNIIAEDIAKDETNDVNNILDVFYHALKAYDDFISNIFGNNIDVKMVKLVKQVKPLK